MYSTNSGFTASPFMRVCARETHHLDAPVVVRDQAQEFICEQGDQGGGSLGQPQHVLQHGHHSLPEAQQPVTTVRLKQLILSKYRFRTPGEINSVQLGIEARQSTGDNKPTAPSSSTPLSLSLSPPPLLVGVQAACQVDELLGAELLGHDLLILTKVCQLLRGQHRHVLQVPARTP